jgi:hypothetical protein
MDGFIVKEFPGLGTLHLGERIEYDVYPQGTGIPAYATLEGPVALDETGPTWDLTACEMLCPWADVYDARSVGP